MRVLMITEYFPLEIEPGGFRMHDFGQRLVAKGHEVYISTGMPNFPTGVKPREYKYKIFLDYSKAIRSKAWVPSWLRSLVSKACFLVERTGFLLFDNIVVAGMEEMGKNGRRAVMEKYNWERESQKLLELYGGGIEK